MILHPKFADTINPTFLRLLNACGVHLESCDTPVQKSMWVPAKYTPAGTLDQERKNAHDLAFLSAIKLLKKLWAPQEKWAAQLPSQIADLITRSCGYGCYVVMWGIFDNPDKKDDLWGVMLLSEDWVPLHCVVCKSALYKTQQKRETFMTAMSSYFTRGDFAKDYANEERKELLSTTARLDTLRIKSKSFRLVARSDVADPVPAELLSYEVYDNAEALSNAILTYRRCKPSLLKKICGAIFLSPDDFKKLKQVGFESKLIRICS